MFLFFHCVRLVGTEFLEENSYYSNKTAPQTFPTAHKQHQIRTYLQLLNLAIFHHHGVWIWKFIVLIHVMTYHSTWQWKGFIQEKKQFKFSAGLTDVTTRPSKMKVSPKIIKSWSSFWGWWWGRRSAKRKENSSILTSMKKSIFGRLLSRTSCSW